MLRLARVTAYCVTSAVTLLSPWVLEAQQQKQSAAPIPSLIIAANKVFISNAGADSISLAAFRRAGDPDQLYNQFYAAMKSWGRYDPVSAPADADLVFAIRFTAPLSDCGKLATYEPQIELSFLDSRTHFALWTFTEPVQGAYRKSTWNKNFSEGMASLMNDLKSLPGQPRSTADSAKN